MGLLHPGSYPPCRAAALLHSEAGIAKAAGRALVIQPLDFDIEFRLEDADDNEKSGTQ